jgi:hypothetical protein
MIEKYKSVLRIENTNIIKIGIYIYIKVDI